MPGVDDILEAAAGLIDRERFGARVTVVSGPGLGTSAVVDLDHGVVAGSLPSGSVTEILADVAELVEREIPATLGYGEVEVFIEPIVPRPRLVVFGAVHIAQALCSLARLMDFHVTVSDSRPAFLTRERFPDADELLVGWPDQIADRLVLDRRTSVVVLSHDARFEDPLWPIVLPRPVRYIGAMGSRRTARRRSDRLGEAGFDQAAIARINGPIGLDIGAESPEEVAIAIFAQMIALHRRPDQPPALEGERRPLARQGGAG